MIDELAAVRQHLQVETIELSADDLTNLRRGTMAGFCAALTPEDWIALEMLQPRLKNAVLVLAAQHLLTRRVNGRGGLEGKR